MFSNLKDKLLNVGSLLYPVEDNKSSRNLPVDLSAGLELLNNFQSKWQEIHEFNETNAENAEKLFKYVDEFHTKVCQDYDNIIEINRLLNAVPVINVCVDNCLQKIKELHNNFEKVEKKLISFESLIEDVNLENRKTENKHQLEEYTHKQLEKYDFLKLELANRHALKERKRLEERQQVFEDAFHVDLETYKNLGTLPKIETKVISSALLEEVQLDLDQEDLESFLNSQ